VTALLDTSVVIELPTLSHRLPAEMSVSTVTIGELAVGANLERGDGPRSAYLTRVQQIFDPIPYDGAAALIYGRLVAAIRGRGRRERSRQLDLMIAAVAVANDLVLYTLNSDDLRGLEGIVKFETPARGLAAG
jgi:tRNA(fMet)-specific endonuclease VapC